MSRDATPREIVVAYRGLAKRLHPDVSGDPESASLFKRATAAYRVLSDPATRGSYDRSLPAAASFSSSPPFAASPSSSSSSASVLSPLSAAAPAPARVSSSSAATSPDGHRPRSLDPRLEAGLLAVLGAVAGIGAVYILAITLASPRSGSTAAPSVAVPVEVSLSSRPSAPPAAGGPTSAPPSASPSSGDALLLAPGARRPPALSLTQPSPPTPVPPQSATPVERATPIVSRSPTPTPIPPTATPVPTSPQCIVPNSIGKRRNDAQATWNAAGFTPGNLTIQPGAGNYAIRTQTPVAGSAGPCATTGGTVGP